MYIYLWTRKNSAFKVLEQQNKKTNTKIKKNKFGDLKLSVVGKCLEHWQNDRNSRRNITKNVYLNKYKSK